MFGLTAVGTGQKLVVVGWTLAESEKEVMENSILQLSLQDSAKITIMIVLSRNMASLTKF